MKQNKKYIKRELKYALFILPAMLIFLIFFLYPVLSTLVYSFTDKETIGSTMNFVGLDNFKTLFTDTPEFYIALKNNIIFTVEVTVIQSLLAFILALALDKKLKGKNFFKTYFFAPVVISSVAISLIWSFMYDPNTGVLNSIFDTLHMGFLKQNWLGNKKLAMFSIAMVQIWQWVGFEMIIFIAGLNTIPKETYEAADIEGANYFQQLQNVILPQIRPAMLMAVVLTTIGCFKVFDLVYIMTSGGPVHSTEVIAKLIYDYAFSYGKMGLGAALSTILLAVIMLVGFGQMYLLRDKD
jgi:ABC-type sugar transport systems, permease components